MGVITNLQALVYTLLPTAVITDYGIGLGKLSADEKLFAGAQMAVGFNRQFNL